MSQSIVIIGAGPAGLTAAYELLKKGQVSVTILEATGEIGGISRTKNYKGTGKGESAQIRPICCF